MRGIISSEAERRKESGRNRTLISQGAPIVLFQSFLFRPRPFFVGHFGPNFVEICFYDVNKGIERIIGRWRLVPFWRMLGGKRAATDSVKNGVVARRRTWKRFRLGIEPS